MCRFWSCILTREGDVIWDKDTSSHERLVKKAGLKDGKLKDRDFVRIEITPTNIASKDKGDWRYKVDEEGTLPVWYESNTLHWERVVWDTWQYAMEQTLWKFDLDAIERVLIEIKAIQYFKQLGEPLPEWKMHYGRNWNAARDAAGDAVGDAVWDAVGDAVWDAARDAVWDAVWDAVGVAALDAARDAAGDAARDAVGVAALDAARDAARDARLYCVIALLPIGAIEQRHIDHSNARMEVWRRGYGLRCDVKGVLYVYGVR